MAPSSFSSGPGRGGGLSYTRANFIPVCMVGCKMISVNFDSHLSLSPNAYDEQTIIIRFKKPSKIKIRALQKEGKKFVFTFLESLLPLNPFQNVK